YKHGSRNKAAAIAACDDLQLAGQALCLEAMTGRVVSEGALYYAASRRRRIVPITAALRTQVSETAGAVRGMLDSGKLPPPTQDVRRCNGCSLRERCQPEALGRLRAADFSRSPFDPDA
ncbi:MAG TPA: Dna2/Cas4 domain-containing protein, partial [Burkholderiaceae bacterium]|nr:Dna2/Cas4 domain-containing protein [Burkholderiaceae bacterium]